jgi:fructokinase
VILVAGESLVDLIAGEGGALVPRPGGGPFNVARTLARLEAPCAFVGAISSDRFGRAARTALQVDGVDLRYAVERELPTTLAVAELDACGSARYRFYTADTASPSLTPDDAIGALHGLVPTAIHVGSLGLALEPLASAVERLVAEASEQVIVMVDPNWRPDATSEPAAWRERLRRIMDRADVVKVSTDDLRHLEPGATLDGAARALLRGRVRCVLVTDGDREIVVVTEEGRAAVTPPAVDVVDTVGAGDAFGAGVLAWWTAFGLPPAALGRRAELIEAAEFAALVAARTCARAGADPPSLRELEAA